MILLPNVSWRLGKVSSMSPNGSPNLSSMSPVHTKERGEVGAQRRVRGRALRSQTKKLIGSEGLQRNKSDPRVRRACFAHCPAPHPKPSLRAGFDLSPQERGEVKKARKRFWQPAKEVSHLKSE